MAFAIQSIPEIELYENTILDIEGNSATNTARKTVKYYSQRILLLGIGRIIGESNYAPVIKVFPRNGHDANLLVTNATLLRSEYFPVSRLPCARAATVFVAARSA